MAFLFEYTADEGSFLTGFFGIVRKENVNYYSNHQQIFIHNENSSSNQKQ